MCINTYVDSATVIKMLMQNGWEKVGQSGSHVQLKHPARPGRVTVPHSMKDLGVRLVKSIEKQSGLKLR